MMRTKLIYSLFTLILLCSCNHLIPKDSPEVLEHDAIKKNLETIATEFLRSWEPPFNPEKALSLFTETEDFHLISDGHETSDYVDWAHLVPKWMAYDEHAYSSYIHEIKNIETVVLSPKSGVVTIVYMWDSITKEGVHARIAGAITLTCRDEDGVWKIVHYHGSHYEPEPVEE
ncbi:MAG: nuclear transport factor 2 family protein [Bacteroidales bacterium]|nr:nuclear transport factor 2 family protein [Bacteroidales bacterium]MCF8404970.1 nuclear transport factor 2 family protein [Bacteroidales bacterium]